jgi:hypothetical protein
MVTNASRIGARTGVVYSEDNRIGKDVIIDAVDKFAKEKLVSFGNSGYSVNTTPNATYPCIQGEPLTVSITYYYDYLFLPFGGTSVNVDSTMVCE